MSEQIRAEANKTRAQEGRREGRQAASMSRDMVENDLAMVKEKMLNCCNGHAAAVSKLSEQRMAERRGKGEITVPPWWYVPSLAALGVGELFINYEGFREYLGVPLFAFMLAFGVGVAVALGSHIHGTWVKQWTVLFRQRDGNLPPWAYPAIFTVICLLVFFSFLAVGWTRYSWVESLIARGLEGMNVWSTMLQGLIPNIIIWLIGIVIAFANHDRSPQLQRLEAARKRAHRHHERAKTKLVKNIVAKRKQYESNSDDERKAAYEATNDVIREVVKISENLDLDIHDEVSKIANISNLEKRMDMEDDL